MGKEERIRYMMNFYYLFRSEEKIDAMLTSTIPTLRQLLSLFFQASSLSLGVLTATYRCVVARSGGGTAEKAAPTSVANELIGRHLLMEYTG